MNTLPFFRSLSILFLFSIIVFSNIDAQDCAIVDLFAEPQECLEDGTFFVDIEFEVQNPQSNGFEITSSGATYDTFEYGQAFYTVGPFDGNCELLYDFIVRDLEDEFCFSVYSFEEAICCDDDCSFELTDIEVSDCDTSGFVNITFNVAADEGSEDGFQAVYNGITIQEFDYGNGPYELWVPGYRFIGNIEFVDAENENCSDFYNLPFSVDCENAPECTLELGAPFMIFECTGPDTYDAFAPIEYNGDSDSLWLSFYMANNTPPDYNNLLYTELIPVTNEPYYLGEFEVSNDLYYYFIAEQDNPFCFTGNEWNDAPDCSEYEECEFFDVEYDVVDCNNSGSYYLKFSFEIENPGELGFVTTLNGVTIDSFEYDIDERFWITGPIPGGCDIVNIIEIFDIENGCSTEIEIEDACCDFNDCSIDSLWVYDFECNNDGSYNFTLDFEYSEVGGELFDVYDGGEYFGSYAYDDLPVRISGFEGRDAEYDLIKVCDDDKPDCCALYEFLPPDCDDEDGCEILEVFAESYECTENSFFIDIEFEVENPGNQGFIIRGNGVIYDTLEYGQLFYTVGPIELDCSKVYEFIIIDIEKGCSAEAIMDDVVCCEDDCEIWDIEIGDFECNDNGTYDFTLDFNYEGNLNEFFEVFDDNELIGFYAYEDLPVRIEDFVRRDVEFDFIKICDNDNPDCCVVHEFRGPDCDDEFECGIEILELLEWDYTAAGNIIAVFEMAYDIDRQTGLDIFVNGEFQYYEREMSNPLEVELDGVVPPDSVWLKICVNDRPDCCDEYLFYLDGEEEGCELYDFSVLHTECVDDFYYLVVDAEHGFSSLSNEFILRGNGEIYGEYDLEDLPIALGPFHIEENINEMVMIFRELDEECQEAVEIEVDCDCLTNIVEIEYDAFSISETSELVLVETENLETFGIELISLDGKKLLQANASGTFTLHKNNYDTGIYIMRVLINDQDYSFKVFMSN